jgi:glycosyltransferase involved in cell wall biosynthesis
MKRVLAITDSYKWATYFRAINLQKNLKNYNFKIISFHDIDKVSFDDFDVVYILNWPIYGYVRHKISSKRKYKLVTGVSSHVGRPSAKKMATFFSIFDSIGLSNRFLLKEFRSAKLKSLVYTPFGVNHKIFNRVTNPNDFRHTFGWVGNKGRSVKRYKEIKKVFKELGPEYKLRTVGNTSDYSREKMAEFYNSIGTLICYSESEGTPNPVLEAAMCGRAIVSSNVGNVPDLMADIESFNPVNSYSSLKIKVEKYSNILDLNKIGLEIEREALRNWAWKDRCKNFIKLFGQ